MTENLKFHISEAGIGVLTLSQPARRNALNAAMWAALPDILKTAQQSGVKVLIVCGDGDHFASGADISEFETLYATPESAAKISADIAAGFKALAEFPVPVIAQIRGACVGGGCGLALCCDIRFSDSTGRFAITPAKLGLVYPFDDIARLISAVGLPNAKDILFSARLIKAEAARNIGLVNFVVPVDELQTDVMEYARTIAALSGQSARVTKAMLSAYAKGQRTSNAQLDADFLAGFSSADFQKGYRAFLEKRKPDFS